MLREQERNAMQRLVAIRERIDALVFDAYGFDLSDRRAVTEEMRDLVPPASGRWRMYFGHNGSDYLDGAVAAGVLSYLVGVAFGRWSPTGQAESLPVSASDIPTRWPQRSGGKAVLVDDEGHPLDIEAAVRDAAAAAGISDGAVASLLDAVGASSLRAWLRKDFFRLHVAEYSPGRRRAPIYWQLSVGDGRYSAWIYSHGVGQDSLYQLLNEVIEPKLRLEERKLDEMQSGVHADAGSASHRRSVEAQSSFVAELRALSQELRRLAPLWSLSLDDGALLAFSPLWRLVTSHRPLQHELKAVWDALCAGEHDWAHLAMHLWPERVVPKCAQDRSLAIAHGLEDVLWVQDAKGKWTPCSDPTPSVEALARERASAAVKAVLTELLSAPTIGSGNGRKRHAGRASRSRS